MQKRRGDSGSVIRFGFVATELEHAIEDYLTASTPDQVATAQGKAMEKLQAGDIFPKLEVETVAHRRLKLPEDLKRRYSVVLYYRGW